MHHADPVNIETASGVLRILLQYIAQSNDPYVYRAICDECLGRVRRRVRRVTDICWRLLVEDPTFFCGRFIFLLLH
jgi:hypothetical protein